MAPKRKKTGKITKRKSAEPRQKKNDSQEFDSLQLEALFKYAGHSIILANHQGEILRANQNFSQLTGFASKELIGQPLDKFFISEKAKGKSLSERIKKRSSQERGHFLLKTKTGELKYMKVHIVFLPGREKKLLVSAHDVSEERKLSLEFQRSKEFLENLIQNSLQAIIAADMDGQIIVFNRAAEELTGYKAEEVIGKKNIVDLYAPGAARAIMKKLRSPLYGGVGRLETTHNVLLSKSGEEIPINMTAAIIYDDQGREIATVGMYQDLRERIEIEKRLRQAQERLLESKRREAIMALAGAMAHELNQPLTSILGYTEILKNFATRLQDYPVLPENLRTSCQNIAQTITEQAERMAETIKKLGELSDIKTIEYAGKQKILDLEKTGKRERKLAQALEMIESAILVTNEELLILEAFGRARDIFGENPEGRSLSRYFEGVNYTRLTELIEKAKSKGTAQDELILYSASGQNQRVKIEIEQSEDKELLLRISDISQRREMESRLKELVAFREELFENLPVPLMLFDPDGKITYLTKEAERMFGYTAEELKGTLPEILIQDFDSNTFFNLLRKLRKEGQLEGKVWVKDKEGKNFLIYYFNRVMRDPSGEVIGYLSFLMDLSEKHLLEKALAEKTSFLEAIQNNTEILLRATDWQEALTAMLAQMRKLLEFDFAGVIPLEPTERGLYFLQYYPATQERQLREIRLYEHLDFALTRLTPSEVIYHSEFNERTFPDLPGDMKVIKEDLLKMGIQSFMVIPLKFQEEMVGSLFIGHHRPSFYQPEKLGPVQQIIAQLAIALSHFRLYMKLEKQRQALLQRNLFLERIIEQSQKIDLRQDEPQIFGQFLSLLQEIFPRGHLWLAWRGEGKSLRLKAVGNLDSELIDTEVALKRDLEERLIDSGHPISFDPGEASLGFLENSKSILLLPVLSAKELIGLLGVESHHKEPFSSEEKFLLQLFSRYLGLVIPNLLRIRQASLLKSLQEVLIESASVFIIMFDQNNRIVIFNRASEEKLGVKKEEVLGMTIPEFIQKYQVWIEEEAGRASEFEELLQKVRQGKVNRISNLRIKFRAKSGESGEGIFNADALRDQEGNLTGVILVGQDLGPLRELQAKMLHSERLAGLGQMAAGVAHELNNPLQAIITSSEMVKRKLEELGEKELARRTETVIQASERIQRLAKSLMNYARPSSEAPQEIELKKLVDEVLSFSGYELRRGGVEIENLVPEDLPKLLAVKDQIEQVLINLLSNAAYACREKQGGKVRIKARVRGQMLELRVEDTGMGIAPENLGRIFEPFFTTKPREKGTGLGLNIVQAIVERHQGKIQVKSKPGEGTVVSILFPLLRAG